MGFLKRLFGMEKPANPEQAMSGQPAPQPEAAPQADATSQPEAAAPAAEPIPAERVGLNGEYDQSGLAKRVALAFDQDPEVTDIETVWVAQLTGVVVLEGKVPNHEILSKMVSIARGVNGATSVETDKVQVG